MQNVSDAYKAAMAKPIRDQGHARVHLSQTNHQAFQQLEANYGFLEYMTAPVSYAMFDFYKVDGSQCVPPNPGTLLQDASKYGGQIGDLMTSSSPSVNYEIVFQNGSGEDEPLEYSGGMQIEFDTAYPQTIRISVDDGNTTTVRTFTNDSTSWKLSDEDADGFFNGAISIVITFSDISRLRTRLRIRGIFFGSYSVFGDDEIESVSWKESISVIDDEFPQQDVSATLLDTEGRYNPEDSSNELYSLDNDGHVALEYGMTLEDSGTEWVIMFSGDLENWSYQRGKLNLSAVDHFRYLNEKISVGTLYEAYDPNYNVYAYRQIDLQGIQQAEMQTAIIGGTDFNDLSYLAEYAQYSTTDGAYSSPVLSSVSANHLSLSSITRRELLQLIANLSRTTLSLLREPEIGFVQVIGQAPVYSLTNAMITEGSKCESPQRVRTINVTYQTVTNQQNYTDYYYMVISSNEYVDATLVPGFCFSALKVEEYVIYDGMIAPLTPGEWSTTPPTDTASYALSSTCTGSVRFNSYEIILDATNTEYERYAMIKISLKKQELFDNSMSTDALKSGTDMTWTNPLLTNTTDVGAVAQWLNDYYSFFNEYDYSYRGLPELDAGDVIMQESPYGGQEVRKVVVLSNEVSFNGAFSGRLKTRVVT